MEAITIITDKLVKLLHNFIAHLPMLFTAIFILILTYFFKKLAVYLLRRNLQWTNMRASLIEVFQKLLSVLIWVIGILIAAVILFPSVTPAKLLTVIGLGSVAIGLAFKDIFENFMAGIFILSRETFQLNDQIECNDYEGKVEKITIRDTHIRQTDGQRIVMPNAMLFKNPVTVITDLEMRRTTLFCGIGYAHDIDEVRKILYQAVKNTDTVLKDPDVEIFANKFSSSSIDFEITWWTKPRPKDIRISRNLVIASIHKALNDNNIEIPYPYRTLLFKNDLEISEASAKPNKGLAHE